MSATCSIVPFTPYEWNRARELYKSRGKSEIEELVRMVSMWIARSISSAPVAISCSKVLLNAILAEIHFESLTDLEKNTAIDNLRTTHGHGIVRFVNYVNEIGQKPEARLLTVVNSVAELGIPRWIVETRHAVAHQDMPPIDVLRKSTNYCLDWLWKEFWLKNAGDAINSGKAGLKEGSLMEEERNMEKMKKEEYIQSIRQFCNWRYQNKEMTEFQRENIPQLLKLSHHLILDPSEFLLTLICDGILIRTPDQLTLANQTTSDDPSYTIPGDVQTFWEPVFLLIFELSFTTEFILVFLMRLAEVDLEKSSQHQIVAYCRDIIVNCAESDSLPSKEWPRILDQILLVPSFFDGKIVELIMSKITDITRKRRNQIRRILNISTKSESVNLDDSMSIKTVEDLQKLVRKERANQKVTKLIPNNENTVASFCDPDDWINVPMGMAPGQRFETFSLIIEPADLENQRKRKID